MGRTSSPTHIVHGEQLVQRRCVIEGLKEMFITYRQLKWQQVQACVNAITRAATSSTPEHEYMDVEETTEEEEEDVDFFSSQMTSSSDSEEEDNSEEEEEESDLSFLTRALCVDSCALHRFT